MVTVGMVDPIFGKGYSDPKFTAKVYVHPRMDIKKKGQNLSGLCPLSIL